MRKYFSEITRIAGSVVTVTAGDVGYDTLAVITSARGSSLAQVIGLESDQVALQIFSGTQGVSTGDRIHFLGHPMQAPFSDDLLGRIFDGAGRPRDGRPEVQGKMVDTGSPAINPTKRRLPDHMIRTGIPMIDIFNSLVESQKLPIFSVPGEPYNELLARVGMQANADIIVLGGMGLRHDDYLKFRDTFEAGGALGRTCRWPSGSTTPSRASGCWCC